MKTFIRSALALMAAAVVPPAVVLVPAVSDLLFTASNSYAWQGFARLALAMLVTSALHVVVLGVPAFLALWWRQAIRWWSALLVGFTLGCIPVGVGLWPAADEDLQQTASYWDGEKMVHTVIDGVPTRQGWIRYSQAVAVFGAFGAVGGLAFWATWRAFGPARKRETSAVR